MVREKLKGILKGLYLRFYQRYEIFRFDRYRKLYDSFSFDYKIKKAGEWLLKYPEQANFDINPVNYWLEEIVEKPASIIEIGGWRGDLADKALSTFQQINCWHNYDLIKNNDLQKCSDKRYMLVSLKNDLWHQSLDFEYNALIATHMIEHINWKEFRELCAWIPASIVTVLFEAPLPASVEHNNWKGDYSSHVFEKGWEQVINEMKNHRFSVVYSENNTVIFKR
jgi:hypothetical protein